MSKRLAVMLALASGCTYATVGSGEVGVVWTPEGAAAKVLPEGEWTTGYYDRTTIYSTRSQGRDEQLEVLASDGARLVLDASIRYHIIADEAGALDRELGVHYYSILLGPTLRSQARRVVGRYRPEEIYSTQRELIERQIREGIEQAIKGRHIVLEALLIRNVRLPERIEQAIDDKLEKEQASLKMKFVIAQAKQEAEKALIDAQAEAERARVQAEARAAAEKIEAQAHADAKRIDAVATDEYERVVAQHITEPVLKLQEIDALRALAASSNAKVIMLGGNGKSTTTLLDVK